MNNQSAGDGPPKPDRAPPTQDPTPEPALSAEQAADIVSRANILAQKLGHRGIVSLAAWFVGLALAVASTFIGTILWIESKAVERVSNAIRSSAESITRVTRDSVLNNLKEDIEISKRKINELDNKEIQLSVRLYDANVSAQQLRRDQEHLKVGLHAIENKTEDATVLIGQAFRLKNEDPDFLNRFCPPGTVIAFAGRQGKVPKGWLLCDGRPIGETKVFTHRGDVDVRHSDDINLGPLIEAIGTHWGAGVKGENEEVAGAVANLPDLRGVFLRGVLGDANRRWAGSRDPDAAKRYQRFRREGDSEGTGVFGNPLGKAGNRVGTVQKDAALSRYVVTYKDHPPMRPGLRADGGFKNDGVAAAEYVVHQGDELLVGSDIRPANAYVNWIIKH